MKKRKIVLSLFALGVLMEVTFCPNEGETSRPCGSPLLNGSLQNLSGSCVDDDTEHIRLEKVNIPENESLILYAFAGSTTMENGLKVTLQGGSSGKLIITHPDSTVGSKEITRQNLTSEGVYCFDFHNEEKPLHSLVWVGEFCDLSGVSHKSRLEMNTLFNSQMPSAGWPVNGNPTGRFFNYKASSDRVKLEKIEGREPIFQE